MNVGHRQGLIQKPLPIQGRGFFIVAESVFSSLKKERVKKRSYKTRTMARADVFHNTILTLCD